MPKIKTDGRSPNSFSTTRSQNRRPCFERLEARECLNTDFELLYKVPYSVFTDATLPDINDLGQVVFFDPRLSPIEGNSTHGRMQVMTGNSAADIHPISSPALGQMVRELRFPEIEPPKLSNNGLVVIWGKVQKAAIEQRLLVHDTKNSIDVAVLDTGSEFKSFGKFDATDNGAVFIGEKTDDFGGVYMLKPNGAVSTLFERKFAFPYLDSVQVTNSGSVSVWYNGTILELREQDEPKVLAGRLKELAYVNISDIRKKNGFGSLKEGDSIEVSVTYFQDRSPPWPVGTETGYRVGIRTRSLTTNAFSPIDEVLTFDAINQTRKVTIDLNGDGSYGFVEKTFLIELYDLMDDPFRLLHVGLGDSVDPPFAVVSFGESEQEPQNLLSLRDNGPSNVLEPELGQANLENTVFMSFPNSGPQSGTFQYEIVPWNARPEKDYKPTTGSITLRKGENSAKFTIPLLADKEDDPIRYAFVVYSNPSANLRLPNPELIAIRDYTWPEMPREYSRANDGTIAFTKYSDEINYGDILYRYVPLESSNTIFDRLSRKERTLGFDIFSVSKKTTFAADFDMISSWDGVDTEAIYDDGIPLAGFSVENLESWGDSASVSINSAGQIVLAADDDVISPDGNKWIAVFRSVLRAPKLVIEEIEEVASKPELDPFNSSIETEVARAFAAQIIGIPSSYADPFFKDLKFKVRNIGNAATGPITASYLRYTTTSGVPSEPWADVGSPPQTFKSIEPGGVETFYFQDIFPPVFDDKIPDAFQGEPQAFDTNVVHQLQLKLVQFGEMETTATTSACTDHSKYAERGEKFLEFLNDYGFENAHAAFDRFSAGDGSALISLSESRLSKDISDTPTFKTWFRANVETAVRSKINQLLRDGFQLGTPYSLSFAGKSVPKDNLSFSPYSNPDLFLTIGGTQPTAPTVTGGPNDFGGRVQVIVESISSGLVKYRWLVTLEDRYNFGVKDKDVFQSYLNVFARGQQICGEAQWFPHEMTIDSGSLNYVLKFDPTTDKPAKDALLGSDATAGQNGELILASSIVETNSQPFTYLAQAIPASVTSLQLSVSSATFQDALNQGTIHLFGRTRGLWIPIGSALISEKSVLAESANGEKVISFKLLKSGLLNGQDFELGFAYSTSSAVPSRIEIASISSMKQAPRLFTSAGLEDSQPAIFRFGDESNGLKVRQLVIGNTGDLDLEVRSIDVNGAHFRLPDSTLVLPLTLAPGEQRSISIEFDGLGAANATLSLITNTVNSPTMIRLESVENLEPPKIMSSLDFNVLTSENAWQDVSATDSQSQFLGLDVTLGASHLFPIDQKRLVFTPQAGDPPSFEFPVTLRVTDLGFPARYTEKQGMVTVNGPIAQSDLFAFWSDSKMVFDLLENDTNPISLVSDLRLEPTSEPVHGSLAFSNGDLEYRPIGDVATADRFRYRLMNSFGIRSQEAEVVLEFLSPSEFPFHNENLPLDVDQDLSVSPLDVLCIINQLNRYPAGRPKAVPRATIDTLFDVDRDNSVTPMDVLKVINFLNTRSNGVGEGEGLDGMKAFEPRYNPDSYFAFWYGIYPQEIDGSNGKRKRL